MNETGIKMFNQICMQIEAKPNHSMDAAAPERAQNVKAKVSSHGNIPKLLVQRTSV